MMSRTEQLKEETMTIIEISAWILGVTSITVTYLQGNGGKMGWGFGFINTLLWVAYTIATKQWGLIPLNVVMAIIHVRNYLKNEATVERGRENKILPKWKNVLRQKRCTDCTKQGNERAR